MSDDFVVQTQEFEGPIEHLLNLIEERKLFINDISLARVTDNYIDYVETLEESDIDNIADFIVVASTLVLIKSKSLLPGMELTDEEESDIEDLEQRLEVYKEIRRLSQYVRSKFGKEMIFSREESREEKVGFAPGGNLKTQEVTDAIQRVLNDLPEPRTRDTAKVEKVIRLEDMISQLKDRIKSQLQVSFSEFAGGDDRSKMGVIVSFLALLELVKQGAIAARQDTHFDDIAVESQEVDTPQYH